MPPVNEIEKPNLASSINIKSVKKAVVGGPRVNPNSIIKKAWIAAICPFTLPLLTPLIANRPRGANELINKR